MRFFSFAYPRFSMALIERPASQAQVLWVCGPEPTKANFPGFVPQLPKAKDVIEQSRFASVIPVLPRLPVLPRVKGLRAALL